MLYPAELQALLQPRGVRLAQDFDLCLGRMLKRFASSVLTSLRGSTYRKEYAFASSLAAALLDEPFEHPVWS